MTALNPRVYAYVPKLVFIIVVGRAIQAIANKDYLYNRRAAPACCPGGERLSLAAVRNFCVGKVQRHRLGRRRASPARRAIELLPHQTDPQLGPKTINRQQAVQSNTNKSR